MRGQPAGCPRFFLLPHTGRNRDCQATHGRRPMRLPSQFLEGLRHRARALLFLKDCGSIFVIRYRDR